MTHASVFSGIGGSEIAAQMLGWDNVFHCEVDLFCNKILDYWFPNAKSYKDVRQTDFREWRDKIDVLSGGFPCQPFSTAGKRKGANDDRYLWPEMLRCIDEIRPTWFVGENVVGITSMVQSESVINLENQASLFQENNRLYKHRCVGVFTLEKICTDIESLQYEVQPVIIPACSVGAPHKRDRIFIIAENINRMGSCGDEELEHKPRQGNIGPTSIDGNVESAIINSVEFGFKNSGLSKECFIKNETQNFKFSGRDYETYRWERFPFQPAVCRGNDGFPFNVDRLSIPFKVWRRQSVKAFGNAIVPQVIYEIFRAIEIVEHGQTTEI